MDANLPVVGLAWKNAAPLLITIVPLMNMHHNPLWGFGKDV